MTDSTLLATLRYGLKQTAASRADLFAPRAFQGSAADTFALREAGLISAERVELLDGTLGSALTAEGNTHSRTWGR